MNEPETIKITVLLLTFCIGLVVGWIICAVGSILTMGGRMDEVEEKMWRDVEAELDAVERREVIK